MPTLQPHQQRVVDEHADLVGRLDRLNDFIESNAFKAVDPAEQARMQNQGVLMFQLATVLKSRIDAFNPPPTEPDFLAGVKACDLSGEGTCEACQ